MPNSALPSYSTPAHISTAPFVSESEHAAGVERLVGSFRAIPPERQVRLAKKTSNLFRSRSATTGPGLDTSGLQGVIAVDAEAQTADVQGMCTYEDLVDATLPYGLMPYVVPQLKTITLGGAVTGLGIESSSFRLGLPHESVLEMDVLTGNGEIVAARPSGTDRERRLFRGFPNSYGSLGYAVRLRIALTPVEPFVALRHVRFDSIVTFTEAMRGVVNNRHFDDEPVDFCDGIVFSASEMYLCLGRMVAEAGPVSRYDGIGDKQAIYYRSVQHPLEETPKRENLRIRDYVWRWDTDWFWCSRAFGAQVPWVRSLWPQQLLRSSFYWKIVAADRRWDLGDKLGALRGEGPRERVVQDVEVSLDRLPEFTSWFLREVPMISPLWVCPLRLTDTSRPLYPLREGETYANIGFWSSAPRRRLDSGGWAETEWNRLIENEVSRLDGHKSLYSEAFYDEATFGRLYGGGHAAALKREFDPEGRFPSLYEKAVLAR